MPDVIIPVLNEAAALPSVLAAMPCGYRAIVADNGSSDGSAAAAQAGGAIVVHEPVRGFGAACWAGLSASDPADGVVCFMDGDGSMDPAELARVAGPVLAGDADLVLGRRVATTDGAFPWHAQLGNAVLVHELRRRTGLTIRDLGPMRATRKDRLLDLGLRDRRFGWPLEMVLRAARAGWRVVEVDASYSPRIGRSKVTGTVRGTARTVRDMAMALR
jgi:glycosyltransferase involved in cell wall biosynthesis